MDFNLDSHEWNMLEDAFPKIAALVGTADGKMDEEELAWTKKIAHIRTFSGDERLFDFYKRIDRVIEEKTQNEIANYQSNPKGYANEVGAYLSLLNPILAKLPNPIGARLYDDMKSFAKHVAKASGGIMRFFSISGAEKQWTDLPMITPIELMEEEE